jgi:hemoglobin-like flavoprotein
MKAHPLTEHPELLTPHELIVIRKSLRCVQTMSGPAADRFFRELFSYDPLLRPLFPTDPWRREVALMTTLHQCVERFEGGGNSNDRLNSIVETHAAYVLNNYHYLYFGAALFAMLESVLGHQFTSVVYGAWFKLFQRVVGDAKLHAAGQVSLDVHRVVRGEMSFAHPSAA